MKEATARDWLEKLKDVSYEMDDALDEWNTTVLHKQSTDKQVEESPLATHCFCSPLKIRYKFMSYGNIQTIYNDELDEIHAAKLFDIIW
ncbi:hypothetical protein PS1_025564 [Malus domestica]